jgi:hypothetical protein
MSGASLHAFTVFAALACRSLPVWESYAKDAKDAQKGGDLWKNEIQFE